MKKVTKLVYAALFSALALVLGLIQIPTPFAPYLALDGSEIVVLVAGNFFGFGIMSTVIILRSVLRFVFGLSTGFAIVGEVAAIVSSFIFGGMFLLIKKYTKNKITTFKTNNILCIVLSLLLIPFIYFAIKVNNNPWLILGIVTLIVPLLCYLIFAIFRKNNCIKSSTKILEASSAIVINSLIMTTLNFFFITPSNMLQKPATFMNVIKEIGMPLDTFVLTTILPLIPFNILKGLISVIVYFILEKTISVVIKKCQ